MKKERLVLGTKNKDKLKELKHLLKGSKIEVLSLADFPRCGDVHEDGRTFEANARKKAGIYASHTGALTLADDSGLMVNFLHGQPGVFSARFAGKGCTYHDNNVKLLKLLEKLPPSKRGAKFVCVMALYDRRQFVRAVKGECCGTIAFEERGENGFGYDPVFIPDGFSRTFAELSPATKNRLSHRGKALRAAKKAVLSYLKKQIRPRRSGSRSSSR